MIQKLILLFVGGSLGLYGWLSLSEPKPSEALLTEFPRPLIQAWLTEISLKPHPVGTPRHDENRDFLLSELKKMGVEAQIVEDVAVVEFGTGVEAARTQNILATIPGSSTGKAILLAAHYDAVPNSHGAGDDGAGDITLLSTARYFKSHGPPKHTLKFLFTDAEELGMLGAQAFVDNKKNLEDIGLVFNFDNRGSFGPVAMFQTSEGNENLVAAWARAAHRPMGGSVIYQLSKFLPNDTDFTVFKKAGLSGLNFAFADGVHNYHSAMDSQENLSMDTLYQEIQEGLAVVQEADQQDLTPQPQASDATFFSLSGLTVVHYPSAVNWLLIVLTICGFVYFFRREKRKPKIEWMYLLSWLTTLAMGFALTFLFRKTVAMQLLSVHKAAVFWTVFFGAFSFHFLFLKSEKKKDQIFSAAALLLILGTVLQILSPTTAYFLLIPSLLASLSLCWFGFGILNFYWAFMSVGMLVMMDGGPTPMIPLLVAQLFVPLILPDFTFKKRSWAFAGSLVLATGFYFYVSAHKFSRQVPRPTSLVFAQNADTGESMWLTSTLEKRSAGLQKYIPNSSPQKEFETLPLMDKNLAWAPAEKAELAPLTVQTASVPQGDDKDVNVKIQSTRGAACLFVSFSEADSPKDFRLMGKTPTQLFRFSKETDKKMMSLARGFNNHGFWRMKICGFGRNEVNVDFKLAAAVHKVYISDLSYDWPLQNDETGAPLIWPWADYEIPSLSSNTTILSREIEF